QVWSTIWPVTVSVLAKTGTVMTTANATTVNPANILRMSSSFEKRLGKTPLILLRLHPRRGFSVYCRYEILCHARVDDRGGRPGRSPDPADGLAARRADR